MPFDWHVLYPLHTFILDNSQVFGGVPCKAQLCNFSKWFFSPRFGVVPIWELWQLCYVRIGPPKTRGKGGGWRTSLVKMHLNPFMGIRGFCAWTSFKVIRNGQPLSSFTPSTLQLVQLLSWGGGVQRVVEASMHGYTQGNHRPYQTQASPGLFLKHNVVQRKQRFWTFEHYFPNFHCLFLQLCNLLPWCFVVILHGCPRVFGRGGVTIFKLCKTCSKTGKKYSKTFFETFF